MNFHYYSIIIKFVSKIYSFHIFLFGAELLISDLDRCLLGIKHPFIYIDVC